MIYLLNTVETYRVDTEKEALLMRDELAQDSLYDLESFSYTCKYDKKADEEYVVVKVKKVVNKEKEPNSDALTYIMLPTGKSNVIHDY